MPPYCAKTGFVLPIQSPATTPARRLLISTLARPASPSSSARIDVVYMNVMNVTISSSSNPDPVFVYSFFH